MKSEIIEMWNNGATSGDIANHFEVTRNIVMGTVYRAQKEGLAVKKGPQTPKQKELPSYPPKPRKKPLPPIDSNKGQLADKHVITNKRVGPATTTLPVTKPPAKMKTMMELTPHDCRWMFGNGMYCSQTVDSILRPWCKEHYRLVYVPRKPRSVNSSRTIAMANFNFSRVR